MCARRVCVCNELELLMATLQPKATKSYQPRNNEAMFKAEIRQPHSPELLVQLFINSSECLRTHSEEEDGGAERCV